MANFTPQQVEQFLQEFFDVVGTRQYTGARYVPIFGRAGSDTVEWDDLAPYEPLTVVMHEGVSYVSRRYVPRGIQITDTEYWVETYRFNAQVEAYRQEVLSFQGQIDQVREDMEADYVPFPDPDTYPKYGTSGQVLTTLTNGGTKWEDPVTVDATIAEPLIDAWLDEHPEATTTVEDGSITNAKLRANKIEACFINAEEGSVTYNPDTYVLTIGNGALWHHGRGTAFSAVTIDGSSVQTSQAFALFVRANGTIYANNWGAVAADENDLFVGCAYKNHVWINGIDPQFVKIIDDSGKDVSRASQDNNIGFYCFASNQAVYDTVNKTLFLPRGYAVYKNTILQINDTTINLDGRLSGSAGLILLDSAGNLSVIPYTANANIKTTIYNVAIVGLIFANNVWINGTPQNMIKIIGDLIAPDATRGLTNGRFAYVGIRDGDTVVYDSSTYTIKIPAGFWHINGSGLTRGSAVTIDGSSVQSSNAFVIMVDLNGNTEALNWNKVPYIDSHKFIVGYAYRNQVVINGVNPSQIRVTNAANANFVYCFGDSITAGVGASKLYHMLWNEWDNKNRFKNYGVGSTGFYVEATSGNVLTGNGVEGVGTPMPALGDNTVLDIMQTVTDPMPNITIAAGTNDWRGNTSASDFRTAVAATLDYALTKTSRVFVMTPIRRQRNDEPDTNQAGLTVKDYADMIIEECVSRGIVYSVGYDVGINPHNAVSKAAFTTDGLHANNAGHARMARFYYDNLLEALGQ